ncbi:probable thimet oligopeptidase [Camellia sinensis]|uniref:probable thimet oligopeptidase n=1 Tax=Camellia sinensis TaxID=4442 RepID=UPI001035950C|nr:probable thimet oligopeptidase [Camellia sinensis]
MSKQKIENRNTNLIALSGGAAALLAIAINFAINALKKNRKKKDLPGSTVQVNLSPPEILRLANRIIAKSKEAHDSIASVPLDKVTYTTAILPLAELEAQQFPLVQSCVFPKLVSTSEDVRKASAEAERRIDAHVSSCSKREDVYRVIKAVAARGEWMNTKAYQKVHLFRPPQTTSETKRYTQCLWQVRDFERSGLSLTLTKREELQQLSAQIDELSGRYIQNLNDDSTSLLISETQLVGLPPEFLESLDKAENGKFKVTLRSHHVSPILELCKVGLTRRIVAVAYGRRCEVNLSILESLVQLRHKSVGLFGYSNYADYAVNQRMANSSSKVFEFLEELSASLTDLATRELSMLKDLKKKAEGDFPFGIEDLLYYVKRIEEQQFNLDVGALKQYFPFNLVMLGILKICHDLFGLRFEEIADAEVWHSDVHLYSVYDLSSSELLGYFYLDMFSREGKYGHTCVVALQNGSFVNGARKIPVALLTSQLQKEVGHTALLRFSEVVNLFHEFGHVVCQYLPFEWFLWNQTQNSISLLFSAIIKFLHY